MPAIQTPSADNSSNNARTRGGGSGSAQTQVAPTSNSIGISRDSSNHSSAHVSFDTASQRRLSHDVVGRREKDFGVALAEEFNSGNGAAHSVVGGWDGRVGKGSLDARRRASETAIPSAYNSRHSGSGVGGDGASGYRYAGVFPFCTLHAKNDSLKLLLLSVFFLALPPYALRETPTSKPNPARIRACSYLIAF